MVHKLVIAALPAVLAVGYAGAVAVPEPAIGLPL